MPDTLQYSNGFDLDKINKALIGRVGWLQSTITGAPVMNAANLKSLSGRFFNDGSFHALVNINNLKAVQEDPQISDDAFNALLQRMQQAAILRSLNGVLNEPEYLEQSLLYNRATRNDQPVNNTGLFVGYEIKIANTFDVSVQINSATFLFDTDCAFTLYLFKDGVKTPVWTGDIDLQANENTVVDLSNCILSYITAGTKGNRYYLGYFQNDLGGARAIQEQTWDWNKTCMFLAMPVSAAQLKDDNGGLVTDFDRNQRYESLLPFGFNLEVSAFRDHTQQVVKKAFLFDELVGLTMAYMCIEQILYNTRSNDKQRILSDNTAQFAAQLDLNGVMALPDTPQTTGLKQRITRELERVKKSLYPKPKALTVSQFNVSNPTGYSSRY